MRLACRDRDNGCDSSPNFTIENRVEHSDPLATARQACDSQNWPAAWDAARAADTSADERAEAERLDMLAEATWWLGRLDDCIDAREHSYVLYDMLGEHRRAGLCAISLYEHYCFRAQPSIAGAWLQRARRLLADDGDCVEHGALLLREAERSHGAGDLAAAATVAGQAVELARRLRVADLEAEALQTLGRVRIDEGRTAEGLELLDEAMLFALEDRIGPYATGKVYCSLISACEELGDMQRAAEWTEATARWSRRHPMAVFPGLCRVHRATALQWHGEWAEAEHEAARACEELADINRPNAAAGWAEIGDIRRRLGDLRGAEEAFLRAEELCGQPRAGLAMLRLAQGRIEAARTIIAEALDAQSWNRLTRAKLLPAHVQVTIAAGELDRAAASVEELEAIAETFASAAIAAHAAAARGRLELATGAPDARATLRSNVQQWLELGVPYEAATAWMLLGQAHNAAGDDDGASDAFAKAGQLFDQLGATLDARQLHALSAPRMLPSGLTEREVEVLRLAAAGLTNREIADELYLSEKTVSRHLTNIFTKIDVSSRAAATAFAYEHGIVSNH
jgi:DNA-binding CsgD family transcriptional regulator/cytochrome c-type biogenesis protein CcmH/NrfG